MYKTHLRVIPTDEGEGAEIRRPVVEATAVVEQRVSHFIMGLAIIGTMTGPLLIVLHTMPTAVFAGFFFYGGLGFCGIQRYLPEIHISHAGKPLRAAWGASPYGEKREDRALHSLPAHWGCCLRGHITNYRRYRYVLNALSWTTFRA